MKTSGISRRSYIISLLPALIMMVIIFLFSSKTAVESDGSSSAIATGILVLYEKVFGNVELGERNDFLEVLNHFIRKGAHMAEYAVLAILLGIHFLTIKASIKQFFVLNIGICVLYAMSDEFHQLFVEGRSGQISDVCIDSIGVLIGTIILYLFARKRFHY